MNIPPHPTPPPDSYSIRVTIENRHSLSLSHLLLFSLPNSLSCSYFFHSIYDYLKLYFSTWFICLLIHNHIHSKYPLGSRVLKSGDTAASDVCKDLSPLKAPVLICYPYSSLNSREKTHSLPCEQPITSAPNNAVTQRKHTHTHQLTEQNSHLLPWRHHYKLFYLTKFKVEPRMPNMSPESSLKKNQSLTLGRVVPTSNCSTQQAHPGAVSLGFISLDHKSTRSSDGCWPGSNITQLRFSLQTGQDLTASLAPVVLVLRRLQDTVNLN